MRKAIENAAVHNGNRSDKKDIDPDMTSGDWEREGMPVYPTAIEYCSMTVQLEDLEHYQQAWDEALKLYNPDQNP